MGGWRIRIIAEGLDPDDQVHVWYSRAGLLVFRARLVGDATDEHGNVLGKMYSQDKYTLQDLSLVGRGPKP